MSLSNLLAENNDVLYMRSLYLNDVDSINAGGTLNLGHVKAARVNLGKAGNDVYINDVLFNPLIAGGYAVALPTASVDNNAILVSNGTGTIQMEYADGTHPGILSTAAQTISGAKTFQNGLILSSSPPSPLSIATLSNYYNGAVVLTFSGGVGPAVVATVNFERIGNIVTCAIPTIYNGGQAASTISTGVIPTVFRPSVDRLLECSIINGSASGATATNAVTTGQIYFRGTGILEVGIGVNNAGTLTLFGGAAVSGSGNGIMPGCFTYLI